MRAQIGFLKGLTALAVAALVAVPVAANAGSVYLNGENIDEVRNIKFDKCTVKIDENGNVMIEAQGYRVKRLEGAAPPPAPVAQQQPPPCRSRRSPSTTGW